MKLDPCDIFKVLSVDTRVKIIELLKGEGPIGAKKIAEELGITPSAVSQHLKMLRHAGLVRSERRGYWIPYSIDEEALENCCGMLIKVCTCSCHNHHGHKDNEPDKEALHSLLRYKKKLEEELEFVRRRIAELRDQGE
jgi:DNA-binding transcriptional ArsR family regulator